MCFHGNRRFVSAATDPELCVSVAKDAELIVCFYTTNTEYCLVSTATDADESGDAGGARGAGGDEADAAYELRPAAGPAESRPTGGGSRHGTEHRY